MSVPRGSFARANVRRSIDLISGTRFIHAEFPGTWYDVTDKMNGSSPDEGWTRMTADTGGYRQELTVVSVGAMRCTPAQEKQLRTSNFRRPRTRTALIFSVDTVSTKPVHPGTAKYPVDGSPLPDSIVSRRDCVTS